MKRAFVLYLLFTLVIGGAQAAIKESGPKVLGIRIGMSRNDALKRLQKIGKLEREERKQQQIWSIDKDPHYSHLIIAFNKEYTEIRFVTAVAREGGRIRYSDVIDTKKARQAGTVNNYKYTLEVPPRGKEPGYVVIARGSDPQYLKYYSIEKID
jgi:hypothetical protein